MVPLLRASASAMAGQLVIAQLRAGSAPPLAPPATVSAPADPAARPQLQEVMGAARPMTTAQRLAQSPASLRPRLQPRPLLRPPRLPWSLSPLIRRTSSLESTPLASTASELLDILRYLVATPFLSLRRMKRPNSSLRVDISNLVVCSLMPTLLSHGCLSR